MIKRLMLKGIRFYRTIRREVTHSTTPHCRYIPTCSTYAVTAISTPAAATAAILPTGYWRW